MKLCRYGKPGYEKPGVIDGEGRLRDLSKVIDDIARTRSRRASCARCRGSSPRRCRS